MPRRFTKVPALALGIACCAFGGDWTTSGADAQRSSWVRADPRISPDSMRKPGFQLAWKVKLASELTPPALLALLRFLRDRPGAVAPTEPPGRDRP